MNTTRLVHTDTAERNTRMVRYFIFLSREIKPDFVSGGIMAALEKDYSHAGILRCDDCTVDQGEIFHSTGKGFHQMSAEEFLSGGRRFVKLVDITHIVFDEAFAHGWLIGNCGTGYGNTQYVSIGLALIAKKLTKLLSKFVKGWTIRAKKFFTNGNHAEICSESVAWFIDDCTIDQFFGQADKDLVTPIEVEDFIDYVNAV